MVLCPDCRAAIPVGDVNVAKDIAFCRACNKGHAISEVVRGAVAPPAVDVASPPPGAWCRDDGREVVIGATARSLSTGVFFLLFATLWNGITWTMLIGTLSGAMQPATGGQPAPPTPPTPPPPATFIVLFLTPFVLIGIATAIAAAFSLMGRVEAVITAEHARIFTGVGSLGWTRRFNPPAVTAVTIEPASWRSNRRAVYQVVLKGAGRAGADLRFASGLSNDRKRFVAGALRTQLGV